MIVRRFSAAHARAAECTSRRVTTGSSRLRIPPATSRMPWTSPSKRSRPCASNSAHSPAGKPRLRLNTLQNDNRDLPGGVLLIADKGGHRFGLGVEQPLALGASGNNSLGLEAFDTHLDRRRRVSLEVVVPGGMFRRSVLRRDYNDSIAILGIHQRSGKGTAALRAGRSQKQERRAHERAAENLAAVGAKLFDQFTVEFAHCLLVELRHGGLLFSGKLCLIVNPVWQFISDLNLGPFVVAWQRLFVSVRRLQDEVFAVTLRDDLQSAWKARVGESRAHRCTGMAAQVERIGEHDGAERVLESLAVGLAARARRGGTGDRW